MNAACARFRARLARLLSGRAAPRALDELSWHEHLLACGECRELLEQEHALDQLLASLPCPELSPELAQRVLAKLQPQRSSEVSLDQLLELSTADSPGGLARSVLAGLAGERTLGQVKRALGGDERALDRLLERVPAPRPPADLAARVLAKARFQRAREQPAAQRPSVRIAPRLRRFALVAGLALALGLIALRLATRTERAQEELALLDPVTPAEPVTPADSVAPMHAPRTETVTDPARDEPSQELLAALDLLESWELVASEDLDVQLNALDSMDELFLSIEADPDASDDAAENAPKKG